MKPTDLGWNSNQKKSDDVDIIVQELDDLYDLGTFTEWEEEFFKSIKSQIESGFELSEKQLNILNRMYKYYIDVD